MWKTAEEKCVKKSTIQNILKKTRKHTTFKAVILCWNQSTMHERGRTERKSGRTEKLAVRLSEQRAVRGEGRGSSTKPATRRGPDERGDGGEGGHAKPGDITRP
jgi:hypothetical protein